MRTITMLNKEGKPFNKTYPRRAENLVKKERAKWVDSDKIIMTSSTPSQDLEDEGMKDSLVMQEQTIFNVGDVVELASGGRPMTVVAIQPNSTLVCTWYGDEDQRHRRDMLPPQALRHCGSRKIAKADENANSTKTLAVAQIVSSIITKDGYSDGEFSFCNGMEVHIEKDGVVTLTEVHGKPEMMNGPSKPPKEITLPQLIKNVSKWLDEADKD